MENLLNVKEVCSWLKISDGSLYQMIYRREIPFVKIGQRVRFYEKDVLAWLHEKRIETNV